MYYLILCIFQFYEFLILCYFRFYVNFQVILEYFKELLKNFWLILKLQGEELIKHCIVTRKIDKWISASWNKFHKDVDQWKDEKRNQSDGTIYTFYMPQYLYVT